MRAVQSDFRKNQCVCIHHTRHQARHHSCGHWQLVVAWLVASVVASVGGEQSVVACHSESGQLGECRRLQDIQGGYQEVAEALKWTCSGECGESGQGLCCLPSAPVTSSPVTSSPGTSSPVTSSPVTSTPVTSSSVTSSPVTSTEMVLDERTAKKNSTRLLLSAPSSSRSLPVDKQLLESAVQQARQHLSSSGRAERRRQSEQRADETPTTRRGHRRRLPVTAHLHERLTEAEVVLHAASKISRELNLSRTEAASSLQSVSLLNTTLQRSCELLFECDPTYRYRHIDGSCNNVRNPSWGASDTNYERVAVADYYDGISEPRRASSGTELPSARLVSLLGTRRDDKHDHGSAASRGFNNSVNADLGSQRPVKPWRKDFSVMVMQWGQYLDHDITLTPMSETINGNALRCCRYGYRYPDSELHPECLPIELSAADPFYYRYGERCMEFVRSKYVQSAACKMGPREQLNQVTAYIDASNVYGSLRPDDVDFNKLREDVGGRLIQRLQEGHVLLPPYPFSCVDATNKSHTCFLAGDDRVNEQINLAVMHTLWMREHNRLVARLAVVNPSWDDETLYQEARRIVAALNQHITYNEFLPIVIGREHMDKTGVLLPRAQGFTYFYDPEVSAAISNEFAAAAYRFGHTLIPDDIVMMPTFGKKKQMPLHSLQFAPFELYQENGYRDLLRGLLEMPMMEFDNAFAEEIVGRLFQFELPFGMDLVALNVQRGREHGIPSYNNIRRTCGLEAADHWDDLDMDQSTIQALRILYESVEDIDLYVGGVSERVKEGALIGPTFHCILLDQFIKLRLGDRFYYEEGNQIGSFTAEQLQEIRKMSLSHVLCNNDNMGWVQENVFIRPHAQHNPRKSCRDASMTVDIDLSHWKDSNSQEPTS